VTVRWYDSWTVFVRRARRRAAQRLSPGVRHPVTVTRPTADLGGARAVVVGAGGNLGAVLLDALVEAGVEVVAFDVHPPAERPGVAFVEGDLTVAADVEALVGEVTRQVGGEPAPVAVFDLAGRLGPPKRGIRGADADAWLDNYRLDVIGPVRLVQGLLPVLGRGSSLTFVVSVDAQMRAPWPHYGTSRMAQTKLIVDLASELAPEGIRVNAVAANHFKPGYVQENPFVPLGGHDIPLESVLHAVLFLADPGRSPMTTGVVLTVDGGMTLEDARIAAWRTARFGR